MAISLKKRFEILRRDQFTCRYCGRVAPSVIVEVDHVMPRSEGGTDEDSNLVAACFECNRGKRAIILDADNFDTLHHAYGLMLDIMALVGAYCPVTTEMREHFDWCFDFIGSQLTDAEKQYEHRKREDEDYDYGE